VSDWATWYLAEELGRRYGYDDCQIEEHRTRLETEAEMAMGLREPELMEVLKHAADAWMIQVARREEVRQRWIRLGWQDARQREAPAVAPAEAS